MGPIWGIGMKRPGGWPPVCSGLGQSLVMRTKCGQCGRKYRWTRPKCPSCFCPNEKRPLLVWGKVIAIVLIVCAILLTVRFVIEYGDSDGTERLPAKESAFKHFFSTPEPTPEPTPKFGE